MKPIHPLTEAQRIFAEQHHEFIYRYLNRRHLDIEKYYDVAVFGYLEAVQNYLENPELQQYRFSVIANVAMRNALAAEQQKQNRPLLAAYQEIYCDDFFLFQDENMTEAWNDQNHLLVILAYLTPKERQMVQLKANGYTYREIATICRTSLYDINSRFYQLRQKVKAYTQMGEFF